jgi:hypothetical protein
MKKDNIRLATLQDALKTSLEAVEALPSNITYEFNEGREAYKDGLSQKKNPYPSFTHGFELWQFGFRYQRDNYSEHGN